VEQLDAIISFERNIRVGGGKYTHVLPAVEHALYHIDQIRFSAGAFLSNLARRPEQLVTLEPAGAGKYLSTRFIGILLCKNACKSPVRAAGNMWIAVGVFHKGGENSGCIPCAFMRIKGGSYRIGIYQGDVSVEKKYVPTAKTLQKGACLRDRMACAGRPQQNGFAAPLQMAGQGFAVGGNGAG